MPHFLFFSEILLSKGTVFFMLLQSEKETLTESIIQIIGYYLKNKSCPLPING
jgi:hypothetical protein